VPGGSLDIGQQGVYSAGVSGDELTVEEPRAALREAFGVERKHSLHDPLKHRDIAADLHEIV
jgi:hypothetical protein